MIVEQAFAKVNLNLHVTGKRSDDYHTLDSVVVFAVDCFDRVTLEKATRTTLSVTGEYAEGVPLDASNLVIKALAWLEAYTAKSMPVKIKLEKAIPVGAGLGGGSADAAAVLRGLITMYRLKIDEKDALPKMAEIGADVPACFLSQAVRMQGIGEQITPLIEPLQRVGLLVNDGTRVPTKHVFDSLVMPPEIKEHPNSPMAAMRDGVNHLQDVAERLYPSLQTTRQWLHAQWPQQILKLSGSGGTYVLYFWKMEAAKEAMFAIKAKYPTWWLKLTRFY